MKKPSLYLQYSLLVVAALLMVGGSYLAMRNWLPGASHNAFIPSWYLPWIFAGEEYEDEEETSYPLHEAAAVGDVDTLKVLLAGQPNVDERNYYWDTPLMVAVRYSQTEVVKLLLQAGADVHLTDKNTSPDYDPVAMLEAIDPTIRAQDEAGKQKMRELLKNIPGESVMEKATDAEIVRLLEKAGGNTSEINQETRALLLGLESEGAIVCSPQEYKAGKSPRYGKANPEKMNVPFWNAMTASGVNAYTAREKFGDTTSLRDAIVWCNQRFGKSFTFLPDGRIIEIGGEHEDFSDPDFHIYNDVFVHHGKGRFHIYGYPQAVFPPTDFHSATLVGNYIYIIGGLGYPQDRRPGHTPVYRLHCNTLAMEKVSTSGNNPGWIHRHRAAFKAVKGNPGEIQVQGGSISLKSGDLKENDAVFVLDLASLKWRRMRNDE